MIPCHYVLAAPKGGSLVLCGRDALVGERGGYALCQKHNPTENYVYVVRRGSHIKIGTTYSPQQRLREVMNGRLCITPPEVTGQPTLLALVPGDHRTERLFHKAFDEYRVEGEWFEIQGAVADWIAPMDPTATELLNWAITAADLAEEAPVLAPVDL